MNIRKPTDYSAMYEALDRLMAADLPQMELYFELGRVVCARPEKGAAGMAAEHLQTNYPAVKGHSPRNLRRMRELYRAYAHAPEQRALVLGLGWTLNVVILEAELAPEERAWYLHTAAQNNWSKSELAEQIAAQAHLEKPLDSTGAVCYTEREETVQESVNRNDEDTLCVPRQYLQEPNGRVCDEGSGEEGRAGEGIPHRVRGHQPGGDREPGLSPRPPETGRVWHLLRGTRRPPASKGRLREVRPADWDGPGQPPQYVPHLRWGLRREDAPSDGVCRPPGPRGGRSLVHRGLRRYLERCSGGVPRAVGTDYFTKGDVRAWRQGSP